jgi:hypothetical protein
MNIRSGREKAWSRSESVYRMFISDRSFELKFRDCVSVLSIVVDQVVLRLIEPLFFS